MEGKPSEEDSTLLIGSNTNDSDPSHSTSGKFGPYYNVLLQCCARDGGAMSASYYW